MKKPQSSGFWGGRGRLASPWVIVFLCLIALLAFGYWFYSRRGSAASSRTAEVAAGLPDGFGERKFPFRHLVMPSASEMFTALRNERPRIRRDNSGANPHRVLILREKGDREKCDGIADLYTEQLRVIQTPPGMVLPSLWDTWNTRAHREYVLKYAKDPHSVLSLRRKLEEIAPAIYDTNPLFVRILLEMFADDLKVPSYQLRIVDTAVGWGGQALGSCAADVGCYHGYLIPSQPRSAVHEYLAPKIQAALSENISSYCNHGEFWVRQMAPVFYKGAYNVFFCHVSNLEVCQIAWDMICPGGWVVMFVPSDDRSRNRAMLALELTREWPEPDLYGVRERFSGKWQSSGALIWKKPPLTSKLKRRGSK